MADLATIERALRKADAAGDTAAAARLAAEYRRMQAQSEAPDDGGFLDTVMSGAGTVGGVVDQAGRGFAEGVTNILGLPNAIQQGGLSVLEFGLDKVGAPQGVQDAAGTFKSAINVFPSAEGMQRGINAANDATAGALGLEAPRAAPDGTVEEMTNRIFQELGAAALPVGAAVGVGQRVGVQGARTMSPVARHFVERAALDPAKFIGREAAVAAGAGLGAAAANQAVDPNTTTGKIADLAGALGGAGLVGTANAIIPRGRDVIAALFNDPKYASQVVKENVVDALTANADGFAAQRGTDVPIDTTEFARALGVPAPVEQTIPGFNASSADRTGDFGLATLEDARARGPSAGRFRDRRDANNEAVNTAIMDNAPTEQPGAFSGALDAERARRLDTAQQQTDTAAAEAENAVRPLTVGTTPTARGNTVRSGILDARDAARQRTSEAYDAADVNDIPVDVEPLRQQVSGIVRGLTDAERNLLPPGVVDRINRLAGDRSPIDTGLLDSSGNPVMRPAPPVEVRAKELTDTASELSRLERAALMDPNAERGGRNAARVMGQVADAIDNFVMSSLPQDKAVLLDQARATRRAEADAFGRPNDPVARAIATGEGGVPRMSDERVAGSFSQPAAMDKLFSRADSPATRQAIREEVLSRADTSTPEGIRKFIDENADQVRRFPGLQAELRNAVRTRTNETTAREQQKSILRELGDGQTNPGRGVVAKYLSKGDENARRAMSGVLSAGKPRDAADELLTFVGDEPAAVQGARRAFWDVMEDTGRSRDVSAVTRGGVEPWIPQKWRRWLNQPNVKAVAERLYRDDPDQLKRIDEIAEALRNVNLARKAGTAVNPSGTAQAQRGRNISMAEIQAKSADVARGRLSKLYFVTYFAGRIANRAVSRNAEQAFGKLLDKALLEPDVAKALLTEFNPANRAAMARTAKTFLGNEAATLLDLLDQPDETVDAITRN